MSLEATRKWRFAPTFLVLAAPVLAAGGPQDDLRRTPVVKVFEEAHGAVVNISSAKIVQVSRNPFDWLEDFGLTLGPRSKKYKTTSVGSGFVIHHSGYLVTNAHVVDRTTDVKIMFDDESSYDAVVVAEDREHDLALLKIEADSPLPVIQLGDSADLMIGETVIAIGNPLGYQHTLTTGVVSATERDLELRNEKTGRPVVYAGLIQIDAGINPGNSGGPLLNVLGELIGINTAIRSDAQNIGFAIPVNSLKQLLPIMIREKQKNLFSLGLNIDHRRRITEIVSSSPADRAGLRVGDIITQVDGRQVDSDFDFYFSLLSKRPGQLVSLNTQRSGTERVARVLLQERSRPDGKQLALQKLGITLEPLTRAGAKRLGLRVNGGLLVASVRRGGPAKQEGIESGDILTALGRFYVSSLDEVGQILEAAQPGSKIYVRILRLEAGGLYRYYTYATIG